MTSWRNLPWHAVAFLALLVHGTVLASHAKAQTLEEHESGLIVLTDITVNASVLRGGGDLGERSSTFSLEAAIHAVQRERNSLHYALATVSGSFPVLDPEEHMASAMQQYDRSASAVASSFGLPTATLAGPPSDPALEHAFGLVPASESVSSGNVHPELAAAALNLAPTPLLGLVGGVFIGRTADASPLLLAAPVVLGGTGSVATGYGISKLFGAEYGWKSATIDFGLGAAAGPAITGLARTTKHLANVRKIQKVPDDVAYKSLDGANGATTSAGKIFLDIDLKGTSKALGVYRHEYVHQILTPLKGLFVATRQRIGEWGYKNSHFLKWSEESLAEGIRRGSFVKGYKFPIRPDPYREYGTMYNISTSRAATEALGVTGGYYTSIHAGLYVGEKLPVD